MANDTKYGKNRNLWRRVYGPKRRKPNNLTLVDAATNVSFSFDLNRTLRHRDFFIIRTSATATVVLPPTVSLAEYDEGLIAFNNDDSAVAGFNFCFTDMPDAVVLTVDGAADMSDFIIPYGITFNSCSMSIGLSAPFNGNIRYRAVYSSGGYPAFVTSSLVPGSGTFRVSAGAVSGSMITSYTASFAALTGTPTRFYRTPWDFFSNFDVDVNVTRESCTTSTCAGDISAPLTNPIYFIAVQ